MILKYIIRANMSGNQKAVGFQENFEEDRGMKTKLKRTSTSPLTLPLSPPLPPLSQLPPPPHEFIIMLIMFIIPVRG